MARRKESGMDVIAALPWPFGIATGIGLFTAIRYGIDWYFSANGGMLKGGLGTQLSQGALTSLAWLTLIACWIAAGFSFPRQAPMSDWTSFRALNSLTIDSVELQRANVRGSPSARG